jgi:glutamine synthetase
MAEELKQFADELESSADFQSDLQNLIRRVFTEHQRIIFNGNGYDGNWIAEAERRGLSNLKSTADALPAYIQQKNIDLFVKHGIYTEAEVRARYEIHVENYRTVLSIEASTMIDMIRHEILPAVSGCAAELCVRAAGKQGVGASCRYETATAQRLSALTDTLMDGCVKLEADLAAIPSGPEEAMRYCHDVLIPDMTAARETADTLETLTDAKAWPFPVYSELLFSV